MKIANVAIKCIMAPIMITMIIAIRFVYDIVFAPFYNAVKNLLELTSFYAAAIEVAIQGPYVTDKTDQPYVETWIKSLDSQRSTDTK